MTLAHVPGPSLRLSTSVATVAPLSARAAPGRTAAIVARRSATTASRPSARGQPSLAPAGAACGGHAERIGKRIVSGPSLLARRGNARRQRGALPSIGLGFQPSRPITMYILPQVGIIRYISAGTASTVGNLCRLVNDIADAVVAMRFPCHRNLDIAPRFGPPSPRTLPIRRRLVGSAPRNGVSLTHTRPCGVIAGLCAGADIGEGGRSRWWHAALVRSGPASAVSPAILTTTGGRLLRGMDRSRAARYAAGR